jgi:hypothetical protein
MIWYCAELDELMVATASLDGCIFEDDLGKYIRCVELDGSYADRAFRFDFIGVL